MSVEVKEIAREFDHELGVVTVRLRVAGGPLHIVSVPPGIDVAEAVAKASAMLAEARERVLEHFRAAGWHE